MRDRRRRRPRRTTLFVMLVTLLLGGATVAVTATAGLTAEVRRHRWPGSASALGVEVESLDGSGNNKAHPDWGKAGVNYTRVAPANYADGKSAPVSGPNTRFLSNRLFNDVNQNIFSERRVSQWGWTWAQFIDHTIGLRAAPPDGEPAPGGEARNIPFNTKDPLESFTNTMGIIPFNRSTPAPGTGVNNPREQINTVNSFVDAWAVYGGSDARLEWLREGPVDGNLANNGPHLLLPGGLLPRRDSRGDAKTAPDMAVDGRLLAQPGKAAVAGDVRANENMALTATQTLFAREHNRVVDKLPSWLTSEQKFQIARRVVIAEQQFITYNEWLPSLGVRLAPYRGYSPDVNTTLSNEFATVGFRGHSMIHGEMEIEGDADRYTPAQLDALKKQGVEVTINGADATFVVPLNVAFFNPDLVSQLQLGPLLKGIGGESEYRNDEMIDNQLRSVMFQVPVADNPTCLDGPTLPACFKGVVDLGAIDVERGRDHGMPTYNEMRKAFGLGPKTSFRAITGESTDAFAADPALTKGDEANDPNSLDFTKLFDINGQPVALDSPDAANIATRGLRRTTLAARLKAVYGSVDKVDAFVGMFSEPHLRGSEFGELELAMWQRQFSALRDGDRFFFSNDQGLAAIRRAFGIDFRRSLSQVIADNTDVPRADLRQNVFVLDPAPAPSASASAPVVNPTASPTRGPSTSLPPGLPPGRSVPPSRRRSAIRRSGG